MYKFIVNSQVSVFLSTESVRRAEGVAEELDKLTANVSAEFACFNGALHEYFHEEESDVSMGDLGYLQAEAWEAEYRLEAFRESHRRDCDTLDFIRRFGG